MEAISLRSRWQQSGSQILLMPMTSVFLSLHVSSFLPSHCILARMENSTKTVCGHLEITQDGLWAHAHHFVLHSIVGWEGTTACGQIMPLIVPQQDAATTPLLTVELLATLCTCALSISPSGFWFSVIVHQRFLKMIVMPPSPAKSDYKPCFQRVTQKLAVLPAPLPLTVSTCTAWTIYLSSMLTASP